jgi:hypothetical protein
MLVPNQKSVDHTRHPEREKMSRQIEWHEGTTVSTTRVS